MSFAKNIKRIRLSNELTQAKMSKKLFMEQSNYSKLETGKKQPNNHIIERISNEFNVDKESLLGVGSFTFENGSLPNNKQVIGSYTTVDEKIVDLLSQQQKILEQQQMMIDQQHKIIEQFISNANRI